MGTALTPGKFYLIESDAGNQDWITNNAGDPDAIDLDNFTEGTDFIELTIPEGFSRRADTGILVTPSGAGKSYDERNAARFYSFMKRGIMTPLAKANFLDKFIMSDRHTSGASATFKRYHLIIYFGTNLHLQFTDASDNQKSYCTGVVTFATTQWVESDNLNFLVRINWLSVW